LIDCTIVYSGVRKCISQETGVNSLPEYSMAITIDTLDHVLVHKRVGHETLIHCRHCVERGDTKVSFVIMINH